MADLAFLDTNIFVYESDPRDPAKQQTAQELVARAASGYGAISYQVVQEFLNVMTGKFAHPLDRRDLQNYVAKTLWPMCEVLPSPTLYEVALSIRETTGWSFYDCLIVSGATLVGCTVLYGEDLQAGRVFGGLEIKNPFN